jgi:hypothetical protein
VLIALRHLVDRARHRRSRADELLDVRRRLARAAEGASPRERALARELHDLRRALAARVGTLAACGRCARGLPLPHGRWDGGQCCGGATADVFDDDEVAALALAGVDPAALVAPRDDHAGCAFRGATGCSLDPRVRPSVCVHYLCRDTRRELHARGALDETEALAARLEACLVAFREARRARLDEALFTPP